MKDEVEDSGVRIQNADLGNKYVGAVLVGARLGLEERLTRRVRPIPIKLRRIYSKKC